MTGPRLLLPLLLAAVALLHGHAHAARQVPIVLWHGMGDSCYSKQSMGHMKKEIEKHLGAGTYVKSLCFGKSAAEDSRNTFLLDANVQVEQACQEIAADEKLRDGYHAVGFSQGGQFLRAVAQRCPTPKMKTLVTLGAQHQGVFGLPNCESHFLCSYARRLLSIGAYWGWIQRTLVQAQYWHDPRHEERYRKKSTFLADINNEREPRNASYAANLASLERFVMVRFNDDSMVTPPDSAWFEYYPPGGTEGIIALRGSDIYKEDRIGLKQLDESGRLVQLQLDSDHLVFHLNWFLSSIVDKYLRTSSD